MANRQDQHEMVEFKADGTITLINVGVPEDMASIVVKYSQAVEDGKKHLICDVYMSNEKVNTQKNVYKVEGDTLTIYSNAEEMANGREPENVFYKVKQ